MHYDLVAVVFRFPQLDLLEPLTGENYEYSKR